MAPLPPDARLRAAMLEAVKQRGFTGTTIGELARQAGVSKSTFYQHYSTKEECFLATMEEIVGVVSRRTGEAYRSHSRRSLREGLRASTLEFSRLVNESPEAAKLVLIDSLTLGATAVPYLERASRHFETMFRHSFDQAPEQGAVSDLEIRAIVGGMRRVVHQRLRAGADEAIPGDLEVLLDWALSYQRHRTEGKPDRRAADGGVASHLLEEIDSEELPWSVPPDSRKARRHLDQRERIMRAAALVATSRGYAALSIPAITATAGVSNQTFYEHFSSKQAAFLEAFEGMERRALIIAGRAFGSRQAWADGVRAGLEALAANIAMNPLQARLAFFELQAAGPAALDRADAAMDRYTQLLRPEMVHDETPVTPPPVVIDAIGGGIWSIIQTEISAGRAESVPEIVPDLVEIVLTPFGLGV